MTHSTLVTDYIGVGLAAARPATPNLSAGALGIYYATDTQVWSTWNGSAWQILANPLTYAGSVLLAQAFLGGV